jgi:hypothetical protein
MKLGSALDSSEPREANVIRVKFAAAGLLLATLLVPNLDANAATSPFLAMAGTWSGGGTITMANRARERVRCRAAYGVAERGENLRLNLRCASDSYNFDLAGDVAYRSGAISGSWSEAAHNGAGTISGRASGERIVAAANGSNFAASLSLTTHGNRQSVAIQPQGTDVTEVSITLNKQ